MDIVSPSFRYISAVQVELLSIVNGKNSDKLLSSKEMYLKNMQTMSLCGQLKKVFKAGVTSQAHVYICSGPMDKWATQVLVYGR